MSKSEAIAPSDKRVLQTLLWALKPFANLRRSIPLPYALTFLTVALEEGKAVGTYAREMNVNRWVMTRSMQAIGNKARSGGPGLDLVTIKRKAGDPTRTEVFLSDKGRKVADQVFRQLHVVSGNGDLATTPISVANMSAAKAWAIVYDGMVVFETVRRTRRECIAAFMQDSDPGAIRWSERHSDRRDRWKAQQIEIHVILK
jgi:hypothetical protein